jgi:hypothetical protein
MTSATLLVTTRHFQRLKINNSGVHLQAIHFCVDGFTYQLMADSFRRRRRLNIQCVGKEKERF